jgi:hypothetical protein
MFHQKGRAIALIVYVAGLFAANYFAFGQIPVLSGGKSLWFYTALVSILLGNLLVTPYFLKPGDVISYGVAALVALGSVQTWASWKPPEQFVFSLACIFCVFVLVCGFATILTKDSVGERTRKWHQTFRTFSEVFGQHRVVFTVLIFAAIVMFHRQFPREVTVIMLAWGLIVARPENLAARIYSRFRTVWSGSPLPSVWGVITAYETPKLVLVRQTSDVNLPFSGLILVKDPHAPPKLAIAMDYVGRDEGLLRRAIEIGTPELALNECRAAFDALPENTVGTMVFSEDCMAALVAAGIEERRARFVGFVVPENIFGQIVF